MSSKSEKGNISPFLLILAIIALISLFISIAKLMIFQNIKSGKYKNPTVASRVIEGTVYDTNGKILSMQVPLYNLYFDLARLTSANLEDACQIASIYTQYKASEIRQLCAQSKSSYIQIAADIDRNLIENLESDIQMLGLETGIIVERTFRRIYPSQFHAAQIIKETEVNLIDLISPKPELNTGITYGSNIYLSIDMDIQYLLDLACEKIYENTGCFTVTGCIEDTETGYIVACTTYPYFDLNDYPDSTDTVNKALPSQLEGVVTRVIEKVTDNAGNILNEGSVYTSDMLGYTVDYDTYPTSVISPVPALEKPKYLISISTDSTESSDIGYLNYIVSTIEAGLRAQSKIN